MSQIYTENIAIELIPELNKIQLTVTFTDVICRKRQRKNNKCALPSTSN
jgi:hypothetical protein